MNLAAQRRVSVIALAVTAVLLSACSPASNSAATPSASTAKPSKTASSTPSPSPTVEAASEERLELTFGAAEELIQPGWGVHWTDPFVTDKNFAVLSPDDGAGSWSYTDVTTACELHFYQGEIFDLDWSQDDRATSDQMLAVLAMGTPTPEDSAEVSRMAGEYALQLEPEPGEVELRTIGGRFPDGRSVVHATRMIGALGGGITISMVCPAGQDTSSEFERISENHLRVLVTK